jgi:hypothetical protein
MKTSNFSAAAVFLLTAGLCSQVISNVYDPASDFSAINNPNGVWSYGYSLTLGGPFHLYESTLDNNGVNQWYTDLTSAHTKLLGIFHNPTAGVVAMLPEGTATIPPGGLALHPGEHGEYSVLRFTAPSDGYYEFACLFFGDDIFGTSTDVNLDGFSRWEVSGFGLNTGPLLSNALHLNAGDHLDLSVGYGLFNGNYYHDSTGISLQITTAPDSPSPVPPIWPGLPGLQQQIPPSEYAALVDFYNSTQGSTWLGNANWNDPSAQSWYGVHVSGFQYDHQTGQILSVGNVDEIILPGNRLLGSIPDSLGNLVNLRALELTGNQLSGSIPDTLGDLVNLQDLHLDFNQLSGSVPDSLGNLMNLQDLQLEGNQLSGSIPDTLGKLANLTFLLLNSNQLSGEIPESLGKLFRVTEISLAANQLSGSVPESLGKLANLQSLVLHENQLSGNIPDLSLLSSLREVWLSSNCFDISPSSQVRTMIHKLSETGRREVHYSPQTLDCGPVAFGDLNNDGCVDQSDLSTLMTQIRAHSKSHTYDLNGDGNVDIADARFLVLHFTNPDGSPCAP